MEAPLRVMIVDDAVLYRKIVADVLAGCPGIEVVGTAVNGRMALDRLASAGAECLVLDLNMPEMDGLQVLHEIRRRRLDVGAVMLSALTSEGGAETLAALEAGAFDFVLKPSGNNIEANRALLRSELASKLEAYRRRRSIQRLLRRSGAAAGQPGMSTATSLPAAQQAAISRRRRWPAEPIELVALGISTGGPPALAEVLPRLPADFRVPVLIVQHMPPVFTRSLAENLDRRCALSVREASDGQPIGPGQVWIAPGGQQMRVARCGDRVVLQITGDPPENNCRPSVDYLFRSVAEVYGPRAAGVIMTGMGNDGTAGCRALKQRGAWVVAQDAATCVVYGMPRGPIESGLADVVAPLGQIADEMVVLANRGVAACR